MSEMKRAELLTVRETADIRNKATVTEYHFFHLHTQTAYAVAQKIQHA